MKFWVVVAALFAIASGSRPALALGDMVVVQATDVIYAAGKQANFAAQAGGTVPQAVIDIPAKTKAISAVSVTGSFSCHSMEGCITVDGGETYHDPDGHFHGYDDATGWKSISGISAKGQGYLVGVFIARHGPSGTAPVAQSYPPMSKHDPVFRPLLDQTFFIGDGLTGDGSGRRQVIKVPKGAKQLVLGISDACEGVGSPGCYADNQGTWTVTYSIMQ